VHGIGNGDRAPRAKPQKTQARWLTEPATLCLLQVQLERAGAFPIDLRLAFFQDAHGGFPDPSYIVSSNDSSGASRS